MEPEHFKSLRNRRSFLRGFAGGLGTIGLWELLAQEALPAESDDALEPRKPDFKPTAKNAIFVFTEGGPSQLDLFDPKPEMKKWNGHSLPESMSRDLKLAFIKPTAQIWASPRVFTPHGQCGMQFSDLLPHLATCADDICMIHSMITDQFNHSTGQLMLNCGTALVGRPSMGAWIVYGLGSESRNLPAYIVLGQATAAGTGVWSSGFLPSTYAGVPFRDSGDPVLYLSDPPGMTQKAQRARLDALRDLDAMGYNENGDGEILSRMASYELAFRMQMAAPDLADISKESANTLEMYGINNKTTKEFGTKCLLARRMIERGVRFVQLISSGWDHHRELNQGLKKNCDSNDQPLAALLKDLKERGLFDTTMVIWGGEFGRTPMVEVRDVNQPGTEGRDHHPSAFTMWMAGGGIKGGQVVGRTDDLGLNVVDDPVGIHDLHATILHCLGLDHERLTFRYGGRDFRLTDVSGQVVHKLLA